MRFLATALSLLLASQAAFAFADAEPKSRGKDLMKNIKKLGKVLAESSTSSTSMASMTATMTNSQGSVIPSPTPTNAAIVNQAAVSHIYTKKKAGNEKSPRKSPDIASPNRTTHIPDNKHTRTIDSEPDPYDNSELQAAIDTALARLKDGLAKSRDAGRVTSEMIEALSVELNFKGSKAGGGSPHKERMKLGDIASVVPKGGRMMQVFCAEEDHIKPIISSIQSSPYSLAPQATDSTNPLLITFPVPPVTQETRTAAVAAAKKAMDKASSEVREGRSVAQKRHRKMEQKRIVTPDELRRAHKKMEDVADAGQKEVKKVHDAFVKTLLNS